MQHRLFTAHDQGMASVVPPLEPCHRANLVGQQINDFTFAFITPMGADHGNIPDHDDRLSLTVF